MSSNLEILKPIRAFAIIGTRDPDLIQIDAAYRLAWILTTLGKNIVRTGGAIGIDQQAMQSAHPGKLEVYLPWDSYNKAIIPAHATKIIYDSRVHRDWSNSVHELHPAASSLTRGEFALHARNYGIVQGCTGVIALPRSDGKGGTSQGVRIAHALNIPVVQGCKGKVDNAAAFISKVLQTFDLAHVTRTLKGEEAHG